MAYEVCPKCGTQKHQLMACSECGFKRTEDYEPAPAPEKPPVLEGDTPVKRTLVSYVKSGADKRRERKIERMLRANPHLSRKQVEEQMSSLSHPAKLGQKLARMLRPVTTTPALVK